MLSCLACKMEVQIVLESRKSGPFAWRGHSSLQRNSIGSLSACNMLAAFSRLLGCQRRMT
jgi:hypothetical protein